MDKPRLCFAGTPAFAAAQLQALIESNFDIVAVYTQPDRPAGRGKKLQASPVKQLALEHEIPVFQPISLKTEEEAEKLSALQLDLMVVVAYGLILPQSILDVPRLGCLNVHASLLPRWRGAAPIERALLAGDKVTGVTIMQMDAGLDTGAMLDKESVEISDIDNRVDLENKLQIAGQTALLRTLNQFDEYLSRATVQDESDTCYAAKLEKSEALIDWSTSASQIDRQIRAGIGRNPAYTFLGDLRLRVLAATALDEPSSASPGTIIRGDGGSVIIACSVGAIAISRVQLPGKTAASIRDITNSRPDLFATGKVFTSVQADST